MGPIRLTHVAGQVRRAGARAFMAPNYNVTWAGDGIARYSRYEGAFFYF